MHDSKTPVTMLFLFPFKKQYILVTYKLKTVQIKVILKRQVIKKDKFIHIRRKHKTLMYHRNCIFAKNLTTFYVHYLYKNELFHI